MREKEKIQNEEKDIKKKALNTMKRALKRIVIRVGLLVGVILLVAAFVLDIFEDKAKKASQFGEKINEAYTIEGNEIKVKDEAIDKIIADLETNESYERVANMTVNEVRTGRKNTLDTFYLCDKLPPETDSNKDEIQEMKRKYIRMFMQAELVTQELNRGGTEQPGKAYGRVYVKRTDDRDTSENGTNTKELIYKPLTEFQSLIDSGNMDAEKYFSINESNQLLVSSWTKTTVNGVVTEFIMTARPIDYKALIQQYSVPYEFLIDLCMQTQSTQFMAEFVNRIFNSRIEITIQDIYTKTTTIETITYDNQTETFKKSQTETISSSGNVSYSPENPEYPSSPTVTVTAATPEVTTTVIESKTPSAVVTYAKTWFVEQTMNYTNTVTTTQNGEGDPNPGIDYPLEDEIGEWIESGPTSRVIGLPNPITGNGSTKIRYTWTKERKSKININQNIKETTETNSYSPGIAVDPISFEKEIIELLEKKYPIPSTSKYVYPGENLSGGAEMFFMLLQTSSRTQAQEQIMRFILYKYTGRDYGVKDFDFGIFESNFSSMNNIMGNTVEEKVWFSLRGMGFSEYAVAGAMGNIYGESGFRPEAIEASNGEGHGLCQWSFGRKQQLFAFAASRGKDWSDVDIQVEFLMGELTKGGGADGFANYQLMNYRGYSPDSWINAQNVSDATAAFCWSFERPKSGSSIPKRTAAAQQYYNQFHGKTASQGGMFLQTAKKCHDYLATNQYYYSSGANVRAGAYVSDGTSVGRTIPVIQGEPSNKRYIDCSAYVSWVLYECGFTDMQGWQHTTTTLVTWMQQQNWERIGSPSQLQAGDVVFMPGHVQIFAGFNNSGVQTWYNAGSTNSIRQLEPGAYNADHKFNFAYRPK